MSPRSEEFLARARDRLRLARTAAEAGFPEGAVGAAYYAMLYAARAALSEEELNAKTHKGTWTLFTEAYVEQGRVDRELVVDAREAQELREAADYDAREVAPGQAETVVAQAERFVTAIDALLEG